MTIEESDFKLVSIKESKLFDLYLLKVINAKDEEKKREEMQVSKHGVTLENGLKYVINYRLDRDHKVLSLREYIAEYKKEIDKLSEIANMTW